MSQNIGTKTNHLTTLLKWLCFAIFLGRGVQFVFWSTPIRHFLYNRQIASYYSLLSDQTVDQWMVDPALSQFASALQHGLGYLFLLLALAAVLLPSQRKWTAIVPLAGTGLIALTGLMDYYNLNGQLHQLMEYLIQTATPFSLYLLIRGINMGRIRWIMRIAIAATFFGHGIYALGIFGQPGTFLDLTIGALGCSETVAKQFLFVAGALDMVVAVGLFFPDLEKAVLVYAVIWGFATAIARTIGPFDADLPWYTLKQVWQETMYRLPHGGLPLAALFTLQLKPTEP